MSGRIRIRFALRYYFAVGTCLGLNCRDFGEPLILKRSARWVFKKHIPSIWHCAPSVEWTLSIGRRGRGSERERETGRDRRIEVLIVSGLPPWGLYLCAHDQLFAGLVNSHLGIIVVSGKAGRARPLEPRHLHRKRSSASVRGTKETVLNAPDAIVRTIFKRYFSVSTVKKEKNYGLKSTWILQLFRSDLLSTVRALSCDWAFVIFRDD